MLYPAATAVIVRMSVMNNSLRLRVLAMAAASSLAGPALAQSDSASLPESAAPPERSWRLGIGLGYGMRTNPLIQSNDIPILVDVDIAWFGKRWFFDNGDVGFELANHPLFTVNAVARVDSDRAFFSKVNTKYVNFTLTSGGVKLPITDPNTGQPAAAVIALRPPKRDYAIELGLEMLMDGEWGQASFRGFHDVSSTHDGYELSGEYSYRWTRGRFSMTPSVGLAYKSYELSDYYWGIHADEASATLADYHAGGGIDWQAGLRANYYLTKSTRIALSGNYERLHGSVARSPIVEQPYVVGYFAGVAWQF